MKSGSLVVLNLRFQIRHAVLYRAAINQHLRNIGALRHLVGRGRKLIADLSGHGESAQGSGIVGQVAEALAEIIGRSEQAVGRSDPGIERAGAAPVGDQA